MKLKRISDLFNVSYGTKFDMNKMTSNEGAQIAFISRSSKNNGLVAYVDSYKGVEPLPAGLITVTLGGTYVLSSFLQEIPFYTAQNVAVLDAKIDLTREEKLYYCMCITRNRYRYGAFGREANRTLKDLLVPAYESIPDWVRTVDIHRFDNASGSCIASPIEALTTSSWKWFRYDELFDIERGRGPRKKELTGYGETPFITSTDSNNGVTGMTTHAPVHNGNVLGVNRNGSVAEAFYQPLPFCSTEDVHIFNPKFEMNKYIGLFLCTLIRKEKFRFGYGRKWGIARMNASKIKLPTTSSGIPDFIFMEKYIKSLPYSTSI